MTDPITHITVYSPTGTAITDLPVTDNAERSCQIMGEDYIKLKCSLSEQFVFPAFSYIQYNGQDFFLKEDYRPTPNGQLRTAIDNLETQYYTYEIKFVSVANMLTKHICYRHVVVGDQQWDEPEININGTLETMYKIVVDSIHQVALRLPASRYTTLLESIYANAFTPLLTIDSRIRIHPNTDLQTFSFSGISIADACTSIANAYEDTEWFIEQHGDNIYLHFDKCEDIDPNSVLVTGDYFTPNTGTDKHLYPYISGGLLECKYAQEWANITNTIVPFGSDRNIESKSGEDSRTGLMVTYGKRLRLDPNTDYTVHDKYSGEDVVIRTDEHGGLTNTDVQNGIEKVVFYDDIYPQCHFKVTHIEEKTLRKNGELEPRFTIEGVAVNPDFTKEYLSQAGVFPINIVEATTLSVRFESGYLNGREFEITNKTTKDEGATTYSLRFTIIADGDYADGTLVPSGYFVPRVGDTFALFNMVMPQVFVDLAKQELAQKAYDELKEIELTRPEVQCRTERNFFKDKDIYAGRRVSIVSQLFGTDISKPFVSRVISYSHKLSTPSDVTFNLASAIMQGSISAIQSAIGENVQGISVLDQRAVNLSRRGWRDASEMAEMLDSLMAEMLLVGKEKNQFAFTSLIECVNETQNGIDRFKGLHIGNGTLQHTQEPYIHQHNGTWNIVAVDCLATKNNTTDPLDPATPYYLYAICTEEESNAQCVLLDGDYVSAQHIDESVPHLLMGILSSEFEDGNTSYRVFNQTNGFTAITGGKITTEQIQDAGRNLIIDFQSNPPRIIARNGAEIIGNIKFLTQNGIKGYEDILGEINSIEIGGENLYADGEVSISHVSTGFLTAKKIADLQPNIDYIATCQEQSHLDYVGNFGTHTAEIDPLLGGCISCLVISRVAPMNDINPDGFVVNWNESFRVNSSGYALYIVNTTKDLVEAGAFAGNAEFTTYGTLVIHGIMLQQGQVATSYQAYVNHLTNAIKGSTDIIGGLLLANLLMVKNERDRVKGGISGLADNVAFWSGGDYNSAIEDAAKEYDNLNKSVPVLIKKDGAGHFAQGLFRWSNTGLFNVGIFEVVEDRVIVRTNEQPATTIYKNKAVSEILNDSYYTSDFGGTSPFRLDDKEFYCRGYYQHKDISDSDSKTFYIYVREECDACIDIEVEVQLRADVDTYGLGATIRCNETLYYIDEELAGDIDHECEVTAGGSEPHINTAEQQVRQTLKIHLTRGTHAIKFEAPISGHVGGSNNTSYPDNGSTARFQYSCTTLSIYNITPSTHICKDGIIIFRSNRSFFVVGGTDDTQLYIQAKGLPKNPTSAQLSSLSAGQLYTDNGFLKVKA